MVAGEETAEENPPTTGCYPQLATDRLQLEMWDVAPFRRRVSFAPVPDAWSRPLFSADSTYVATKLFQLPVKTASGRLRRPPRLRHDIQVNHVQTGEEVALVEARYAIPVAFTPTGNQLVAKKIGCNIQGRFTVLDLRSNTTREIKEDASESHASNPLAVSPDASTLALIRTSGEVTLWDFQTGRHIGTLPCPRGLRFYNFPYQSFPDLGCSSDRDGFVAFSLDGRRLIWAAHYVDRDYRPYRSKTYTLACVWDIDKYTQAEPREGVAGVPVEAEPLSDDADMAEAGPSVLVSAKRIPPSDRELDTVPDTSSTAREQGSGLRVTAASASNGSDLATATAALRTWESADGRFHTRATLIRADADTATLETADGRAIRIPLARLSAADRQYVLGRSP
jgi:WD40 repeat protein